MDLLTFLCCLENDCYINFLLYFRRVRNASGAGSVDTPVESQEENSNSMPVQAASCPSTPATGLGDPLGADTPPCFRFLKTKRVSY